MSGVMEDGGSVPVPLAVRTSDLKVRTLSAVVMLAAASGALWAGGLWWAAFVALVALVGFGELARLVWRATLKFPYRILGIIGGILYFGIAGWWLASADTVIVAVIVLAVVSVDVFAYLFGRTIGGPKIAPKISPSKTWAGLAGGIFGATICGTTWVFFARLNVNAKLGMSESTVETFARLPFFTYLAIGACFAVVAQAGDFFESWLKRRAGVKDSSKLIPGHGGVFDRIDGLIAVTLLTAAIEFSGI